MWCNQIFSLLALEGGTTYRIGNIIVADNYEVASKIARNEFGETALAVDTTFYPVSIGFTYCDGTFYNLAGNAVAKSKTDEERIKELAETVNQQEEMLTASDEAVVLLYEMQSTQSEINDAQDEAITGLYEIMLS